MRLTHHEAFYLMVRPSVPDNHITGGKCGAREQKKAANLAVMAFCTQPSHLRIVTPLSGGSATASVSTRGLRALNAGPVQRALKKRFGDVEVLPGERVFFSIVHAPGQGETGQT